MNDDNFLDAMEALREGYPRDIEPVKVVPDPSYVKGHSDGVAEDREAILAIVRQDVESSKYEGDVWLLENLLEDLKRRDTLHK